MNFSQIFSQAQVPVDLYQFLGENEQGDARLFKMLFQDRYVYDPISNMWAIYSGHFWERDLNNQIWKYIGDLVAGEYLQEAATQRAAGNSSKETEYTKRAAKLRTKKRVTDVIDWAKTMMPLPKKWDEAPMQLPCANGVIDLRTGEIRDGQPDDYIILHAPTLWKGLNTPAPNWEKFFSEVFNNDIEMIAFIQRLMGYILSGMSNEKVIPIFYGENGNNGKTTFVEIINTVIGTDFCKKESATVLMEAKFSGGEKPSAFIVSLPKKRFFWANESKEGARFDIGLLKELAGGDTMSGRGLYAKVGIQFRPTFVVVLVTNRLPHLDADDNAAWNRILPIEFKNSFVDNPSAPNEFKINRQLPAILASEASGILAWLVRGCLEWQRVGLNPPGAVIKRRNDYRESEDDFGLFCEENITPASPTTETTAKELYGRYRTWAEGNGFPPFSSSTFGRKMAAKKYVKKKTNRGIVYPGIALKP